MVGFINILLILIIILTIVLFWILAVKTDILRDPGTCKDPNGKNSFSLGRTQFGIWAVIIFCTFICLLTLKKDDPGEVEFTESVAILLGISAGTTVLSRSIDGQSPTLRIKNRAFGDGCSRGFLRDILSDSNGVSVHRFQQVLFTILLIYVFIHSTIKISNFPDIDGYLLTLSGISSGGYLGIKISE
ncbi:hypothetical protein RT717_11265 [Imperialibacter roseus]|uniref:Uncharacterized protein n=1 Tax=Imperialibacter roseus TaxID=1324217 RepID=A0ABZ0IZU7_9BACT|nr:hypothetical protein [Imperialibacter roseus]WOK09216.1 hypothetical protein RT717_11265 [Imperialibacter roseus]